MRTIYVDLDYKCHVTNDGTRKAVEDPFFDGKCDTFVEGYCYKSDGDTISIYPCKPYAVLEAAQAQYEQDMADLQKSYEEGVNSAYD